MLVRHLKPAVGLILVMTVIVGLLYPGVVTFLGTLIFRSQATGSLIYAGDQLIGSRLIGQSFSDPKYFWGRPSATSPQPYKAEASSGSNLGPSNPALLEAVKANVEKFRAADPDNKLPVPVELVTASGSGLDPDISPAAAQFQSARVARARHLPPARVEALVREHEIAPRLGILGTTTINVLELNLALDRLR